MQRDDVVFRGTKDGLSVVLNDAVEFDQVVRRLQEKLAASVGFFQGASVTVHVGQRRLTLEQRQELEHLLREPLGLELREVVAGVAPLHAAPAPARPPAPPPVETLVVRRTLRSGQQVVHRGSVVILGDVNPGAEVVATGHIVVMGVLRGIAHAGADGDTSAVVVAEKLQPTQLRIANVVARSPDDGLKAGDQSEVARLYEGSIIIEASHGAH